MKKNSKTKIAHVYSKALYDAALEGKCVDKVWADVSKLKALIDENGEFASYMTNPLWSDVDKIDVLNKTAKALGLNKDTLNCMQVIVENRRMAELGSILDDFNKLYYAKNDIAEVLVETVKKLSSVQSSSLQKTLEKFFGKKVVIDYQIVPSILGGLRIRCGSKMIDGSLMSKLNYLGNIMKGK